jgi:hypothetical protein
VPSVTLFKNTKAMDTTYMGDSLAAKNYNTNHPGTGNAKDANNKAFMSTQ